MHYSLPTIATTISLLTLLLAVPGKACGSTAPRDWGKTQGNDLPQLDQPLEHRLDELQAEASHQLIDFANWIDSFFRDERAVAEENSSRASLRFPVGYSRNDKIELQPRFDWQLRLPGLSSQMLVFLQVADENDRNLAEADTGLDRTPESDADEGQLTAGFKYFLKEGKKNNISIDSGANWDYAYGGLRFRSTQELGSWLGRVTNRLLYFTDDGIENRLSYDLEKQLAPHLLLRATTSGTLYEENSNLAHSQQLRLYRILASHQVLSVECGVFCDTKPGYNMSKTKFEIKYRQRFFRDWLALEIAPQLSFPEEHGYEANPGIFLRLEASFGYKPEEAGYQKIFH